MRKRQNAKPNIEQTKNNMYRGPLTNDDIFFDVYRRGRNISCSDRMCGAEDCSNCRPSNQDSEQQYSEQQDDEQQCEEEDSNA